MTSEPLQRFYEEFIQTFPSMDVSNEVFEVMEEAGTDNRLTECTIGKEVIYAAFAWSASEDAYSIMRELAKKHKVGFIDVSGMGEETVRP